MTNFRLHLRWTKNIVVDHSSFCSRTYEKNMKRNMDVKKIWCNKLLCLWTVFGKMRAEFCKTINERNHITIMRPPILKIISSWMLTRSSSYKSNKYSFQWLAIRCILLCMFWTHCSTEDTHFIDTTKT